MTDLTLAICMYNAEQYIEETLQSVMAQTMQNFHLLIVNDCCTDKSKGLVEEFFIKHPRQYELCNMETNQGIGYARHFAEQKATTQYMMFLDSDDVLYPDAIEKMYNKIKSDNDLMAVGCYLEYIDSKGKIIGGGLFLGETVKEKFYEKASKTKMIFMQPTAIYDRNLSLSVGGYNIEGYPDGKPRYQDYCEDLDLWTRMSDLYKDGKAIIVLPEVLCKYRKGNGLSANRVPMILKMRYVKTNLLRRRRGETELSFIDFRNELSNEELKKINDDAKSADSLSNAYYCLKKGQPFLFIKYLFQSVVANPKYIVDKIRYNLLRTK